MLSFDFLNSLYLHHNLSFRAKVRFSFVGQYTENEIFAYCSLNTRMRKMYALLIDFHLFKWFLFLLLFSVQQRAQLLCSALMKSIGSLFVETSYFKPISTFYLPYHKEFMTLFSGLFQNRNKQYRTAKLYILHRLHIIYCRIVVCLDTYNFQSNTMYSYIVKYLLQFLVCHQVINSL